MPEISFFITLPASALVSGDSNSGGFHRRCGGFTFASPLAPRKATLRLVAVRWWRLPSRQGLSAKFRTKVGRLMPAVRVY